MTVEQPSVSCFPNQLKKETLSRLKEITGVDDVHVLGQALEASMTEAGKYDLNQAISILIEEKKQQQQQQQQSQPTVSSPPTVIQQQLVTTRQVKQRSQSGTGSAGGVIDLTNEGGEKEDDLQKAIALSLQEQHGVLGGQVTMEEQDISRVLEASLAESKAVGTKRKRGEVWQDSANPHDRKRPSSDWPVGMKNVGNTCWFAAVIQSLFHLPVFRRLVLNFVPHKDWSVLTTSEKKNKRNILFMQELRKLFALMVASRKKYVDPSCALEVLREAFPNSTSTDHQQDITEFSHKLLEWLEEAFKLDTSRQKSATPETLQTNEHLLPNPMVGLFYGHYKSEGQNGGHPFMKEDTFGQYPLQVNNFGGIHESLESALAQEIESNSADSMTKSGQETWFTQLPPVLLFQLSRFHFNQHLGMPEKIHHKWEFPEVIYMDRYMETNKLVTRVKREHVYTLKEQRRHLHNRLEKYINYGSGAKRVPLQDVLHYVLEFVENRSDSSRMHGDDVEMASPASSSSMAMDSPCESPHKVVPFDNHGETPQTPTQEHHLPTGASPAPKHVSDVELRVLQGCLRRWRTEVETDVKELQDHIAKIDDSIKEIYNESSLKQVPYRLHAVLVHEGQAASGHYWAYIYCQQRSTWLKFNDVTVTDATWVELQKESVGGHHHASAYCLMYIDKRSDGLFEADETLEELPEDLQRYVEEDNDMFLQEIERWEIEQSRKKDGSGEGIDPDCAILEEKPSMQINQQFRTLQMEHANMVFKNTTVYVNRAVNTFKKDGPLKALNEVTNMELLRLERLAKLLPSPSDDTRLQHVGVYMLMNEAPVHPFLYMALLEQFSHPALTDTIIGKQIRQSALEMLEMEKKKLTETKEALYAKWHDDYSFFRRTVTLFVIGIEKFHNQRYKESLPYLFDACNCNCQAMKNAGAHRGLDPKLLLHYRRKCLLELSKSAVVLFRSEDAIDPVLEIMNDFIIPGMASLMASDAHPSDSDATVEIRDCWFSLLEEEISDEKQEKLQDFLAKILEPGAETPAHKPCPHFAIPDLDKRYAELMGVVSRDGELQCALESK